VLEVGCGPGAFLGALAAQHPDVEFLGIDVDPKMIVYAVDRHSDDNVTYKLLDLATEVPDLTVDFAYTIDVLHHVRSVDRLAAGIRAVLRDGATWLAIEPNLFHPYVFWSQARMRRAGHDEDHFRPWRAEPALRAAGFDVADRSFRFFFPGWVERVPRVIAWLEPLLERFRPFGGSVVYRLQAR